jgi:hypothetical protein
LTNLFLVAPYWKYQHFLWFLCMYALNFSFLCLKKDIVCIVYK